jgi:hypothetical protein
VERLGERIGVSAYGRVGGDASARFGVVHPHHFNKRKKRELRIKGCRAPSAKGSFQTCNAGRAAAHPYHADTPTRRYVPPTPAGCREPEAEAVGHCYRHHLHQLGRVSGLSYCDQ